MIGEQEQEEQDPRSGTEGRADRPEFVGERSRKGTCVRLWSALWIAAVLVGITAPDNWSACGCNATPRALFTWKALGITTADLWTA